MKDNFVIRYGIINDKNPQKGLVRVLFSEDKITSGWIPMLFRRSSGSKEFDSLAVKEKVVCLMDCYCDAGIVLGSYYDATNQPPGLASDTTQGRQYSDGTQIYYDTQTSRYTISIGTVKLQFDKTGIFKISNGTDSLGSILTTLTTSLTEFATACEGSTIDPVLVTAATALNTNIALLVAKIDTIFS